MRIAEHDRHSALAFERFEISLLRRVGLRPAAGELGGEADLRGNSRRPVWQFRHERGQRLRFEIEQRADPTNERRGGLEPEGGAREVGALALGDGGEIDLPLVEWYFRGRSENRRRSFLEDRVLLVLHGHLTRAREKRVGAIERHAPEVVIDGVVSPTRQRDAIDEQPLRVGPDLHGAEHQRTTITAAFGLRAHPDVIDRFGTLGRASVFGRRRIDRVVGGVAANSESVRREWLSRREDQKLIADGARTGRAKTELEVRITGPRPDSVLQVEARAVGRLGETEQLEVGIGGAGDGLLLVLTTSGDDLERDALPSEIRPAKPIHAADLTIESRIAWLDLRIPDQVCKLVALGTAVGEVGRTASAGVDRIASRDSHSVCDYQSLVVE